MPPHQLNAYGAIVLAIGRKGAFDHSGHGPDVISYDVSVKHE